MLGSRSAYTRARILDAAERLFAQRGHEATSLREITAVAHVNLSSVHYHFGSKEGLVEAVFNQLVDALNRERLSLLETFESENCGTPLRVAHIIEAYFRPLIHHANRHSVIRQAFLPHAPSPVGSEHFLHLMPHADTETGRRFRSALAAALPSLPLPDIVWRLRLMLIATCCALHYTEGLNLALQHSADAHATNQRLLEFLIVGVRGAFSDQWQVDEAPKSP